MTARSDPSDNVAEYDEPTVAVGNEVVRMVSEDEGGGCVCADPSSDTTSSLTASGPLKT